MIRKITLIMNILEVLHWIVSILFVIGLILVFTPIVNLQIVRMTFICYCFMFILSLGGGIDNDEQG